MSSSSHEGITTTNDTVVLAPERIADLVKKYFRWITRLAGYFREGGHTCTEGKELRDDAQMKQKVKKLLKHVREGKWESVMETYKKERGLRTEKITENEDTVLHMALSKNAYRAALEMVSFILREDKEEKGHAKEVFGTKNKKNNTALHLAASMGYFRICEMICKVEPSLVRERNTDEETPLFLAAHSGNKRAFLFLHYLCMIHAGDSSTHHGHAHYIQRGNDDTILHCAIAQGHIEVAIEIFYLYYGDLVKEMKCNKDGLFPLHLLAAIPSAFKSTSLHGRSTIVRFIYRLFRVKKKKEATTIEELEREQMPSVCRRICFRVIELFDPECMPLLEIPRVKYIFALPGLIIFVLLGLTLVLPLFILALFLLAGYRWLLEIRKMKEKHKWTRQIMNGLLEHTSHDEMLKTKHDNELVETPLMIAAKNGVIEMVERIMEKFPSMIDNVNDEGKNIVLVAAENRQTQLYKFLWNRKDDTIPESAFRQVDQKGNTALHLAAMSGANLNWQTTTMIGESKWFELVKKSVPSNLREQRNNESKSAEGIFRESYGELMKSDLEWVYKTSQACSVVSSLVATMVFPNVAASSNNDSGKPTLINKFGFKTLPNPYLVTLFLSLMSTISFLGILASRFQSAWFWMHVPFMLHIGMFFMYASLVSLWISLMLHDHSTTTYVILGSPIGFLIILLLTVFIGPTLKSMYNNPPSLQPLMPQKGKGKRNGSEPKGNGTDSREAKKG
ncbi:uncharacterized protein LOC129314266 [Prosopis cineraria]|uniref:uncharacterized protein LOC129314266 n=1 Tax=Prosopis cineraria TaxID=364024 RepID=UPI00240FE43E|nr:uncharacterized protein LOC129314266 [Prosopis cineraria]